MNDGGPAFPEMGWRGGMSLLDWFTAIPMGPEELSETVARTIMIDKPMPTGTNTMMLAIRWWLEAEARYRYMKAEAMLAERERRMRDE